MNATTTPAASRKAENTNRNPVGTITNMIAPAGYWEKLDSLSDHKTDSPEYKAIQAKLTEMVSKN